MATRISAQQGNDNTQRTTCWIDDVTIALSVTPVTWASIPLSTNSTAVILVTFNCVKNDYSASYGGYVSLSFVRGSGNISKQGTIISNLTGGITGNKPTIDLQANTSTQSIDIVITGQTASTTIWSGYYEIIIST